VGRQHLACSRWMRSNDAAIPMGGNEVKNPDFLARKKKDLDAAFYALAHPGNCLTKSRTQVWRFQKTLENGTQWSHRCWLMDWCGSVVVTILTQRIPLMIGKWSATQGSSEVWFIFSYDEFFWNADAWTRESYRVNESGEPIVSRAEYSLPEYEIDFWINNYKKW